jgi:anaerobic ribonucleoside-triphosphate reductase activating protein
VTGEVLRVADLHRDCRVLGPGSRFAVWVQGCPLSCPGCISPQWIPFDGGRAMDVDTLAEEIADTAVDGLTISGGEPFAQAPALTRLVTAVRERRDLSVLCYSGYRLSWLRERGDAAQRGLLSRLDVLIDGPYSARLHAALRWRGSSNQRVHRLSSRDLPGFDGPDVSAGLQLEVTADGDVQWLGVPPIPGFRQEFERRLGLAPAVGQEAAR